MSKIDKSFNELKEQMAFTLKRLTINAVELPQHAQLVRLNRRYKGRPQGTTMLVEKNPNTRRLIRDNTFELLHKSDSVSDEEWEEHFKICLIRFYLDKIDVGATYALTDKSEMGRETYELVKNKNIKSICLATIKEQRNA